MHHPRCLAQLALLRILLGARPRGWCRHWWWFFVWLRLELLHVLAHPLLMRLLLLWMVMMMMVAVPWGLAGCAAAAGQGRGLLTVRDLIPAWDSAGLP